MAVVTIPDRSLTIRNPRAAAEYLSLLGIRYERWNGIDRTAPDAAADTTLTAWTLEIDGLKAEGGYAIADVIDVTPKTTGLEQMVGPCRREHWHDEEEVRFILRGHGTFHIHRKHQPVSAIEVEPGDLIRVPPGTLHWFDLCADRTLRAIRFFRNLDGATPHYTGSGIEALFETVCLGPSAAQTAARLDSGDCGSWRRSAH